MDIVITNANINDLCAVFHRLRREDGSIPVEGEKNEYFPNAGDKNLVKRALGKGFNINHKEDVEEYVKFVVSTPIGTWDVRRVTDMNHLFDDMTFDFADAKYYHVNDDLTLGDEITVGDDGPHKHLNRWDTSNVTNMSSLFSNCERLKRIFDERYEINWDTSHVVKMDMMFALSRAYLGDAYLSEFNVSNVISAAGMFLYCEKFTADLSSWDVSKLEDAESMFSGCRKFNSDISNWDVGNIKRPDNMFEGCKKFNRDLSKWRFSSLKRNGEALDPTSGIFMFIDSLMSRYPKKWPRLATLPTHESPGIEEATGGRRHRRKTKKVRNQAKRGGSRKSRKGRKAGRRTRNAKKHAKRQKAKATRRHSRN
jgi:surface protein